MPTAHIHVLNGRALCITCDVINLNVTIYSGTGARIDLSAQQAALDIDGILTLAYARALN